MAVQRESARAVIKRCKTSGVKVVAGGPLFTMEHEGFPDVDHFVFNVMMNEPFAGGCDIFIHRIPPLFVNITNQPRGRQSRRA